MHNIPETIESKRIRLTKGEIHYLTAGQGTPVVLLHGWPTSAHLWRNIIPELAGNHRVIAPDLPGFGLSAEPNGERCDFEYHYRVLNELFERLPIEAADLVLHDLGGPVGLLLALRRPQRVKRLVLLNTIVYPELAPRIRMLMSLMRMPLLGPLMCSPFAFARCMRLGVADKSAMQTKLIEIYKAPYRGAAGRAMMRRTLTEVAIEPLVEIAAGIFRIKGPLRIIYGEKDFFLPEVAREMERVAGVVPGTRVTALSDCGHFLQEDRPVEVGRLIAEFLDG